MVKYKITNPNIKMTDEVEDAMAKFVPRFGEADDIAIVRVYGEIKHLLSVGDIDEKRRAEMEEAKKKAIVDIKQKESRLLWLLKKRQL
jgi:hypothetical protein